MNFTRLYTKHKTLVNKCARCDGLLTAEDVHDAHDAHVQWYCINCGERFDELVLFNRLVQPQKTDQREARRFPIAV